MKYYWMSPKEEAIKAVAYTLNNEFLSINIIKQLATVDKFPLQMELHSVFVTDKLIKGELSDDFMDYQPNDFGCCSLISSRLKKIIVDNLIGTESLRWISVIVKGETQSSEYYIPYFSKYLDTLDPLKTVYAPVSGVIIKPSFDYEKMKQFAIFHGQKALYWQMSHSLYVNETIRHAVQSAKIPGLEFEMI